MTSFYNFVGAKKISSSLILVLLSIYIATIFSIFYRINPNILLAKVFHVALSAFIWFNIIRALPLLLSRHLRLLMIYLIFITLNIGLFYLIYLKSIPSDLLTHLSSLKNYLDPSSVVYTYFLPNLFSYPFSMYIFQNAIFLNIFEVNFFNLDTFLFFHLLLIYSLLFCVIILISPKLNSFNILILKCLVVTIFNVFPLYSVMMGSIIFVEATLIQFISFAVIFRSDYVYRDKFILLVLMGTLNFFISPSVLPQFGMLFLLFSMYFGNQNLWFNHIKSLQIRSYVFSFRGLAIFSLSILVFYISVRIFVFTLSHYYDANSLYIVSNLITSKTLSFELLYDNYFMNGTYLTFYNFPFLFFLYCGVMFVILKKGNIFLLLSYLSCLFLTYLGNLFYLDSILGIISRAITTMWLGQVERLLPALVLFSLFVISNFKNYKSPYV